MQVKGVLKVHSLHVYDTSNTDYVHGEVDFADGKDSTQVHFISFPVEKVNGQCPIKVGAKLLVTVTDEH